jgi:hypothetical protein
MKKEKMEHFLKRCLLVGGWELNQGKGRKNQHG